MDAEKLGPPDDIRDNELAMIYRWPSCTKLHLAKKFAGCFGGHPDMIWQRRLSDEETQAMLENPWRLFDPAKAEVLRWPEL